MLAKVPTRVFHREVLAGEQLIYEVEMLHLRPEGASVEGRVTGRTAAVDRPRPRSSSPTWTSPLAAAVRRPQLRLQRRDEAPAGTGQGAAKSQATPAHDQAWQDGSERTAAVRAFAQVASTFASGVLMAASIPSGRHHRPRRHHPDRPGPGVVLGRRCGRAQRHPHRSPAFDASALPTRIAGEIPDFDAKNYIDKNERKSLQGDGPDASSSPSPPPSWPWTTARSTRRSSTRRASASSSAPA